MGWSIVEPEKKSSWSVVKPDVGAEYNMAEAAGLGAVSGLTSEFDDELYGATFGSPLGAIKAAMGTDSSDPDVAKYIENRNIQRKRKSLAQSQNPASFMAGGITGSILGPGKFLKGGNLVAKAAGLGGAIGLGGSSAELSDNDYLGAVKDTAIGAGTGAIAQKGVDKLSSYFNARNAQKAARLLEGKNELASGGTQNIDMALAKNLAKDVIGKAKPVANANNINASVKNLAGEGIDVPASMLTDDPIVENLQSYLLKSPTFAGEAERRSYRPIFEGIEKAVQSIDDAAGGLGKYEAGNTAKNQISKQFNQRIDEASKVYQEIEGAFGMIPINKESFKQGINKLRAKYVTDPYNEAGPMLDALEDTFGNNVQTVADLKPFRTIIGRGLNKTTDSPIKQDIANEMYNILTRERNRSILRFQKETGKVPGFPQILSKLKQADALYRDTIKGTAKALGIDRPAKSTAVRDIRNFIKGTPSEGLADRLFNKNNLEQVRTLQERFPDSFEVLRKRALKEIVEQSSYNGKISAQKLSTRLSKFDPNMRQLILGENAQKMGDISNVLGALPRNFNPSDTATKLEFSKMLNPYTQINAAALRGVLKNKVSSTVPKVSTSTDTIINKLQSSPSGSKFMNYFKNNINKDNASIGATYFLLYSRDPEFRQIMDKENQ